MALNFPDSPSNGDTFQGFKYNSSRGVWNSSKLAPVSAVTVYANLAAFPSSGNTVGDYAFATDTKAVYIWDGAEWDRISSGGDEIPTLTTTPASTHNLSGAGTNTSITIAASDPDGFPITYSHDTNPASPNQVTNIVNNNGVFTLVPSTNTAHAGNFTLRLKASDGVSIKSHSIAVSLAFNTIFTFDTSESTINSNYTADNKVEVVVGAGTAAATAQQSGKLGKGYIEYKMISIFSTLMVGVQVGTNTGGYNNSTGHYTYANNGGGYPGGYGATPGGSGGFTDNDIIMLAYDTAAGSNGQVWWGKNGTWRSGVVPGVNPGNDLGTDSSSLGLQPAFHNGSSSTQTAQIELISHTQGAQYTIPTGWELA